ncbi:GAF domain-containing sensor histidine kinase [Tamlana sp. 62-3]|uniref:histidine kinase n=1 Tax=Neotamlana sargassicola TaxID=2883125 RepID=A0A9X1I500_9FLAO|nr:GAF domain-containing sensor histidine kinase [Tamlana sargassicola]MCB4806804.1 GAF domain-containing sensor histidine kinase [Tamlana sargassicola]
MIAPKEPENEGERLEFLKSFNILDTLPEADYDNITKIAAEICGVPIALVSLIDDRRQWFKSHHGLNVTETPKEFAFCAHAINRPNQPFVINDSREDERFHDNPLVTGDPHVVFYAGIPLTTNKGMPLGTLCVIDNKPHQLTNEQLETLKALSNQVIKLLELRKANANLQTSLNDLKDKNEALEKFAYLAAHDLKSPLLNISNLAQIIKQDYKLDIDDAGLNMLELIIKSSEDLTSLVDGLLSYNTRDSILNKEKEAISLKEFESDLQDNIIKHYKEVNFTLNSSLSEIEVNKYGFNQIIRELVNNAIRYNDKNQVNITLNICETASHYRILVQDNGPGIHENYHEKIFNVFYKLNKYDKFGRTGNGIGLATVKNIIKKLQGEIHVNSILNKQTTFSVILKK